MLKQCDDCKGIFRLSKMIAEYLKKFPNKVIYCPYCNGVSSHVYVKQNKFEIPESKRGEMYLHFGKKYIENE